MPGKVFVSYSHKDAKWLDTVQMYLAPQGAGGLDLELWTDRDIEASAEWEKVLEDAVNGAQYSVLLVTQNFLNSRFSWEKEVPKLLELREKGHVIFWIPVAPSTVKYTALDRLQAVWSPSQPLSALRGAQRAQALVQIADRIRNVMAKRV